MLSLCHSRGEVEIIYGQVLVVSFEDAPTDEMMPIASARFHPVRPLVFLSRAYKREPKCDPSACLYHWFQDSDAASHVLSSNWRVLAVMLFETFFLSTDQEQTRANSRGGHDGSLEASRSRAHA